MEVPREASSLTRPLAHNQATKSRRGQIEILVEILSLASSNAAYLEQLRVTKTHLAGECSLNFHRLEKYLRLLVERGLVEAVVAGEKDHKIVTYRTTESGERMRKILLEAEELIFGGEDPDGYVYSSSFEEGKLRN